LTQTNICSYTPIVAEDRVRVHELEGMARSMTVGPLPNDQIARLLHSYEGLAKEQAEVKAQLVKMAPAWAELRKVLNELNRVLES
jgi:hypothetical protein